MTLVLIAVPLAAGFALAIRMLLVATSRAHDEPERAYQEETEQWAAEVEGVPLDWLDDLDWIRRLPEVHA